MARELVFKASGRACHHCNSINELDAGYCISCGKPLLKICPNCGKINPPYERRHEVVNCLKCGELLNAVCQNCKKATPLVSGMHKFFCGHCGKQIEVPRKQCPKCRAPAFMHDKICRSCGTKLPEICPKCGEYNKHNINFCTSCGQKL